MNGTTDELIDALEKENKELSQWPQKAYETMLTTFQEQVDEIRNLQAQVAEFEKLKKCMPIDTLELLEKIAELEKGPVALVCDNCGPTMSDEEFQEYIAALKD